MIEISKEEAIKIFRLYKDIIYALFYDDKQQKVYLSEIEKFLSIFSKQHIYKSSNEKEDIIFNFVVRHEKGYCSNVFFIINQEDIKIQNRKEKIQSIAQ